MDQQELARQVISQLDVIPEAPANGRYLEPARASEIVDETIEHVRRTGSAIEYVYLLGHRHRLATSLTMIPYAESDAATCLDVGCYGYMAYWAWKHLGYSNVEGIELNPNIEDRIITKTVKINGNEINIKIHNFNISDKEWPIQGTYDTILFFETLEHVDKDHSGVMLNITQRMNRDSYLVMSVPNSVSYKTFNEFVGGAPPWTYWFFNPDLEHEPRHSFEYTPIFFKILLKSAGLDETAFRTICAYSTREAEKATFDIANALSIEPHMFGDTMIAQARKTFDEPLFRYPDCLYNGDSYYRSVAPLLADRSYRAKDNFLRKHFMSSSRLETVEAAHEVSLDKLRQADARLLEITQQLEASEASRAAFEKDGAQLNAKLAAAQREAGDALKLCEEYLKREQALRSELGGAEAHHRAIEFKYDSSQAELAGAREQLRQLEASLAIARSQTSEALSFCEQYRYREENFQKALDSATQREQELQGELSTARLREEDLHKTLNTSAQRERELQGEMELARLSQIQFMDETSRQSDIAKASETRYQAVVGSSIWRATAPARRLAERFPRAKSTVRAILIPPARFCRAITRRLIK